MGYCIFTLELGPKAADTIMKTEGYWEGSLAKKIIFKRALSESEIKRIEEYLRKKWFSSFDLLSDYWIFIARNLKRIF